MKTKIYSILLMIFSLCLLTAYASTKSELEQQIEEADAIMFNAFNACDIHTMSNMFSKELEFYHDIMGMSDYSSTMEATINNCKRKLGLQRTLLEEGAEISPLGSFGAMQKGKHRFCHMNNGKEDCGVFDFIHLWKKEGDRWLIHRVISYNH